MCCGNFVGTHLGAPDPSGPLRQRDFAVELSACTKQEKKEVKQSKQAKDNYDIL